MCIPRIRAHMHIGRLTHARKRIIRTLVTEPSPLLLISLSLPSVFSALVHLHTTTHLRSFSSLPLFGLQSRARGSRTTLRIDCIVAGTCIYMCIYTRNSHSHNSRRNRSRANGLSLSRSPRRCINVVGSASPPWLLFSFTHSLSQRCLKAGCSGSAAPLALHLSSGSQARRIFSSPRSYTLLSLSLVTLLTHLCESSCEKDGS